MNKLICAALSALLCAVMFALPAICGGGDSAAHA